MNSGPLIERRGQRILVTGGAGFVGSHIVDALHTAGHHVLVVDNLSTGRVTNVSDGTPFALLDIADSALWPVMQQFRPAAVVHAAAQASVPVSVGLPQADARANILGTINLVQASLAAGVEQFIYVNTGGALYGSPRYLPLDEDHPVEPISPYGLSKWTAEQYVRLLAAGTDLTTKVLRLSNVYGPRQSPDTEAGVVSVFASRMLEGLPVTIHGDGQQTRDFVFVRDVARAVLAAFAVPGLLTVHVSSGRATTVSEVFRAVAHQTGYRREPEFAPAREGDIRHSVLSNERAAALLGWSPAWSLSKGIAETVTSMANAIEPVPARVAG